MEIITKVVSTPSPLPYGIAMGLGPMGEQGNLLASRVWKGDILVLPMAILLFQGDFYVLVKGRENNS